MRKYKMIFFNWDGTAVTSRIAPVDAAAEAMAPLLASGVKLAIISDASFNKIDNGKLAGRFDPEHRSNLFFGLDRGAHNFRFDMDGKPVRFSGIMAGQKDSFALHKVCFDFHIKLLRDYGLNTDIVFCRDNFCKIDVGADILRSGNQHLNSNSQFFINCRMERVNAHLASHGYAGGLSGLITMAKAMGREYGLSLKATTDAKYIELGFGTKSDSVDAIFSHIESASGACPDCCFWGGEYLKMDDGLYGSDAYMITDKTKDFEFFDVSDADGERPEQVLHLGGGVERFLWFLRKQACA